MLVLPAAAQSHSDASLKAELKAQLSTLKKDKRAVRFLRTHDWLLTHPQLAPFAKRQLKLRIRSLAATQKKAVAAKAARVRNARTRTLAALEKAKPQTVICRIFGAYCRQALVVSHCESRFRTTAQNGQYEGLFQMGSSERHLYGHGDSAVDQVVAAHRYFVASGRDWSPWSCKP